MILRIGNPCSLTIRSYAVTSMFLNYTVLRSDRPCFLVAWSYTTMFHKLVFWVLARIYYPILIYMLIIEVCCMIFHNSIPGRFTIRHNIIDVVAWSYTTIFCLSAGLMKIQVRTLVILFTCHTRFLRPKPDAHRMYAQDQVVIHTVRM
jgi:hypothetical protein